MVSLVAVGPSAHAVPGDGLVLKTGPVGGPCGYSNTFGAARPGGRKHLGVDIIAAEGVPLIAVDDGVISKVVPDAPNNTGGNYLRLKIADGSYYSYLHLQAFAEGIVVGSRVTNGQVIGYVGMTGSAPVPHLHFEVHPIGGDAIDPTPLVYAAGTCGPPYDQGTAKPKPAPRVTTPPGIPLIAAVREGALNTTVVDQTVPAPADSTDTGAVSDTGEMPFPGEPFPPTPDVVTPGVVTPGVTTTTAVLPTTPVSSRAGGLVVFESSSAIPADHVTGVKVVGFPGLPASSRSITLSITMVGDEAGRAAVWPCGTRAGLDGGIPLLDPQAGAEVGTTVTLAPGDQGRVCIVATTRATLRVAVLAVG